MSFFDTSGDPVLSTPHSVMETFVYCCCMIPILLVSASDSRLMCVFVFTCDQVTAPQTPVLRPRAGATMNL